MTRIGQPKGDQKAEFWTAVGGRYRVSLDYVVTLSIVPGVTFERGPEVRTHTVRVGNFERHRAGGVVRFADGRPAPDAWIVLPDLGAWTTTGADGRFSFSGLPSGRHRCECRAPSGAVVAGELVVPGAGLELTAGDS
jgi:hypothetical protein